MTDASLLQHYLQAGETNISNLLLHHYKELGMTTSQFVLYLQFKILPRSGNNESGCSHNCKELRNKRAAGV